MSWRSALVAFPLALAPGLADAAEGDAACAVDLGALNASFEETIARLTAAGDADQVEKCAALRHHIDVMTSAREIFQRCLTGLAQRENVGQMIDLIEDFNTILAQQKCE